MNDLGKLQQDVWEQIREATQRADGVSLRRYGDVAADMDRKYDEWRRCLEADGGPEAPTDILHTPPMRDPRSNAKSYEDFSGRPIHAMELSGARTSVGSYKELLLSVIERLQDLRPNDFEEVAQRVHGRGPYFSMDPKDLRIPHKLTKGRLYVETNLNANLIVEICRRLVEASGLRKAAFKIEAAPNRTRAYKRT